MWQLSSVFVELAQFSPCVPPVPSSQVMKTAVRPARYVELLTIFASQDFSHASPVLMLQLCMSLQILGVMNENAGSVLLARSVAKAPDVVVPSGTSFVGHLDATSW